MRKIQRASPTTELWGWWTVLVLASILMVAIREVANPETIYSSLLSIIAIVLMIGSVPIQRKIYKLNKAQTQVDNDRK